MNKADVYVVIDECLFQCRRFLFGDGGNDVEQKLLSFVKQLLLLLLLLSLSLDFKCQHKKNITMCMCVIDTIRLCSLINLCSNNRTLIEVWSLLVWSLLFIITYYSVAINDRPS